MGKNLINEANRRKFLAGIITESQYIEMNELEAIPPAAAGTEPDFINTEDGLGFDEFSKILNIAKTKLHETMSLDEHQEYECGPDAQELSEDERKELKESLLASIALSYASNPTALANLATKIAKITGMKLDPEKVKANSTKIQQYASKVETVIGAIVSKAANLILPKDKKIQTEEQKQKIFQLVRTVIYAIILVLTSGMGTGLTLAVAGLYIWMIFKKIKSIWGPAVDEVLTGQSTEDTIQPAVDAMTLAGAK